MARPSDDEKLNELLKKGGWGNCPATYMTKVPVPLGTKVQPDVEWLTGKAAPPDVPLHKFTLEYWSCHDSIGDTFIELRNLRLGVLRSGETGLAYLTLIGEKSRINRVLEGVYPVVSLFSKNILLETHLFERFEISCTTGVFERPYKNMDKDEFAPFIDAVTFTCSPAKYGDYCP